MLILKNTSTLDIGNMGSGILFDHDNDKNSMSSVNTFAFAQRKMPDGAVHGLAEATGVIRGTLPNEKDNAVAPSVGAAYPKSNSASGPSPELP